MHNLYVIFVKILNMCKQVAGNLVNESGNVPKEEQFHGSQILK